MIQAITNANRTATISGVTNLATAVDIVITDEGDAEVYSADDVAVADDEFSYTTVSAFDPGTYTATVVAKDAEDATSTPKSAEFIVLAEDNTGIAGFVEDDTTNDPLANVTVTIAGQTAVTNNAGFFHVEGIVAGTHSVTFERATHLTETLTGGDRVRVQDGSLSTLFEDMTLRDRDDIEVNSAVLNTVGDPVEVWSTIGYYDAFLDEVVGMPLTDFTGSPGAVNWGGTGEPVVPNFLNYDSDFVVSMVRPYEIYQDDALHAQEREFTTLADGNINQLAGFEMVPVEEMDLTVNVRKPGGVVLDNSPETAGVELLTQDGEPFDTAQDDTLTGDDTAAGSRTVFADLTLPDGTYYLRVTDDLVGGDARVSVFPVEIEEGVNKTVTVELSALAEQVDVTINTAVGYFEQSEDYDIAILTADGAETGLEDNVNPGATDENSLQFDDFTDTTNDHLAPGDYIFHITGDYIVEQEIAFTVGSGGFIGNVDVTRAGTVAGNVQQDDVTTPDVFTAEEDADWAVVQLLDGDGNVAYETDPIDPADNGDFQFVSVAPGEYTARAYKAGFEVSVWEDTIEVAANADVTAIDFDRANELQLVVLEKGAQVGGTVRYATTLTNVGANATVSYYNEDGDLVYEDATGAAGDYEVGPVLTGGTQYDTIAPGTYQVVVRDQDGGTNSMETFVTSITVEDGDDLTVNYNVERNLNKGTLTVRVVNEHNVAQPGWDITVLDQYADRSPDAIALPDYGIWTGITGADGEDDFDEASAGTYEVRITQAGMAPMTQEVTVVKGQDATLEFVADTAFVTWDVNVKTVDEANADLPDTEVVALDQDGEPVTGATANTDVQGEATIELPNGTYTLMFYNDGYYVESRTVTVDAADQTLSPVQLALW